MNVQPYLLGAKLTSCLFMEKVQSFPLIIPLLKCKISSSKPNFQRASIRDKSPIPSKNIYTTQ